MFTPGRDFHDYGNQEGLQGPGFEQPVQDMLVDLGVHVVESAFQETKGFLGVALLFDRRRSTEDGPEDVRDFRVPSAQPVTDFAGP